MTDLENAVLAAVDNECMTAKGLSPEHRHWNAVKSAYRLASVYCDDMRVPVDEFKEQMRQMYPALKVKP